ncbi:MAG TPA: class II aldolase/adducin family protein [Acidobacteriaceae bacterium]|nr:class II aldolase/adducin family protein [Acidobacteriaceae bacterium]
MKNVTRDDISTIVRRAVLECLAANRSSQSTVEDPLEIFSSSEVNALKEEIIRAGKKLWERQYVDGNGGNISVRVSSNYVLCTPTLCSKGDLCLEDFSLVDLENCQICGDRPQTSEILLHLEIYKAVPAAKAVIHCHPPYATAHAVAGVVPQGNLIPEQEVFIGPVALAPYETPGTRVFARTVLPFVKDHNTILLANHGIVCWADTVTHAEWYVEVIDNYCKTVLIASQLRPKLNEIPPEKIADLLAIKQKLGLPDPRLRASAELIETTPVEAQTNASPARETTNHQMDELIRRLTEEVDAFMDRRE